MCAGVKHNKDFLHWASVTKGGKDTNSAKSQKKYFSSMRKVTRFNMNEMIQKGCLLNPVTQLIIDPPHLIEFTWILNICLKDDFTSIFVS